MTAPHVIRVPGSDQTNREIAHVKERLLQTLQLMRAQKDALDTDATRVICAGIHTIVDSVRVQVEHAIADAPPTDFIPLRGD